jgi:hypothetical protein
MDREGLARLGVKDLQFQLSARREQRGATGKQQTYGEQHARGRRAHSVDSPAVP